MKKVIYLKEIQKYSSYLDQGVIDYLNEDQTETFESFKEFDIVAFDWYDIDKINKDPSKIMIYIDRDDLFFICENQEAFDIASKFFEDKETNDISLYFFFKNLFKGSTKYLEDFEDKISMLDESVIKGKSENIRENIILLRSQVLRLKKYYEQFDFIFSELVLNDNEVISHDSLKYFRILKNRSKRFIIMVSNAKDYLTQVRESYQSQVDIEQNEIMKVFTVVTSIFLPLTLIVGWYGMNLKMPEFEWDYGYLFVTVLCIAVGLIWYFIFKKRKWF